MELSQIPKTPLVRQQCLAVSEDPWCIAVAEIVAAMHSGLNSFGKKFDASLVQVWMLVLEEAGATTPEVYAAMKHWVNHREDFPPPKLVVEWILERRKAQADRERLPEAARLESERLDQEFEVRQVARFGPNWRDMPFEERRKRFTRDGDLVRALFGEGDASLVKTLSDSEKP